MAIHVGHADIGQDQPELAGFGDLERGLRVLHDIDVEAQRPHRAYQRAHELADDDVRTCKQIGEHGVGLIEGIARRPLQGHGFYEYPGMFRGWVSMHIHNMYLAIAHKIGIPGLVGFLGFVIAIFHEALRGLKRREVDGP